MTRITAALTILGLVLAASIVPAPRSGSLPSFPVTDEGRTGAPLGLRLSESYPSDGGAPLAAHAQGWASWYNDGPGLYAAVHSWHWHDKPYRLRVVAGHRSVVVTVRDFCACGPRHGKPTLIDLSPAAFRRLAPLSQGVLLVRVFRVGTERPIPTAPSTDLVQ